MKKFLLVSIASVMSLGAIFGSNLNAQPLSIQNELSQHLSSIHDTKINFQKVKKLNLSEDNEFENEKENNDEVAQKNHIGGAGETLTANDIFPANDATLLQNNYMNGYGLNGYGYNGLNGMGYGYGYNGAMNGYVPYDNWMNPGRLNTYNLPTYTPTRSNLDTYKTKLDESTKNNLDTYKKVSNPSNSQNDDNNESIIRNIDNNYNTINNDLRENDINFKRLDENVNTENNNLENIVDIDTTNENYIKHMHHNIQNNFTERNIFSMLDEVKDLCIDGDGYNTLHQDFENTRNNINNEINDIHSIVRNLQEHNITITDRKDEIYQKVDSINQKLYNIYSTQDKKVENLPYAIRMRRNFDSPSYFEIYNYMEENQENYRQIQNEIQDLRNTLQEIYDTNINNDDESNTNLPSNQELDNSQENQVNDNITQNNNYLLNQNNENTQDNNNIELNNTNEKNNNNIDDNNITNNENIVPTLSDNLNDENNESMMHTQIISENENVEQDFQNNDTNYITDNTINSINGQINYVAQKPTDVYIEKTNNLNSNNLTTKERLKNRKEMINNLINHDKQNLSLSLEDCDNCEDCEDCEKQVLVYQDPFSPNNNPLNNLENA